MQNKRRLKRVVLSFLMTFILIFNINSNINAAAPTVKEGSSLGLYLYEDSTQSELYNYNGNKKMYPASTTKIMTAAITLDYVKNLDEEVTVGSELDWLPAGSSVSDLIKGEFLSYEDLLYGLMIPSGNDAAIVLACNVGNIINGEKTSKEKAYDIFVDAMNKKAKELGMNDTHFANPHGFHDSNHYSTPHDMVLIAAYADNYDFYNRVVNSTYYETTTNKTTHKWSGHNYIIVKSSDYFYNLAKGDKTGYTSEAGRCVIVSSENSQGVKYYAAVLHASSTKEQFTYAKNLLKYGNTETKKLLIEEKEKTLYKYTVQNLALGETGELKVKVNDDIYVYTNKNSTEENFRIEFSPNEDYLKKTAGEELELVNSIHEDDNIGDIKVYYNNKLFKSVPAFSKSDVNMRSTFDIFITNALIFIALACLIVMALVISSKHRTKKRLEKRKKTRRRRLQNEIKAYGSQSVRPRPAYNSEGKKIKIVKKNKPQKRRPITKKVYKKGKRRR
ncbi:serine hydrolase [Anaerofustis butyriciformans]|uniref:serine hydrolase n=1 Tax=Anaerofustis butyriciformans TaxID=3108533 RepID=UPI003F8C5507